MHTVPLSKSLGVELPEFDIKQPCSPREQATLRRLFCEHHLLLVRGQAVTAEDQHRFVGYFGPIHEVANGNDGTYVTNRGGHPTGAGTGKVPGRLLWHSDGVYGPQPGIATSLWGQEVWPDSVPTGFANAARAFERLPEGLCRRIEGLHAVFLRDLDVERTDHRLREAEIRCHAPGRFTRHVHPVVWQMPHTNQKVLLINELMTSHIVELPPEEGEALIQELFSRMYAADNVYTHYWQSNDLIIWDNQALQHCRPVMGDVPRHLRRLAIDGWYTDEGLLEWRASAYGAANVPPEALVR
jgi:taurine dioxygenase